MSGVIYGGKTLDGKFVHSCISYENDWIHGNDSFPDIFARIEYIHNSEKDWVENIGGRYALVSYMYSDESRGDKGFSCYDPIRSFELVGVTTEKVNAIKTATFDGALAQVYGQELFERALSVLLEATEIDITLGICMDDHGVCRYKSIV